MKRKNNNLHQKLSEESLSGILHRNFTNKLDQGRTMNVICVHARIIQLTNSFWGPLHFWNRHLFPCLRLSLFLELSLVLRFLSFLGLFTFLRFSSKIISSAEMSLVVLGFMAEFDNR